MVGGAPTKSPSRMSSVGNVERLQDFAGDSAFISGPTTGVKQIKIITEVCVCVCVEKVTVNRI